MPTHLFTMLFNLESKGASGCMFSGLGLVSIWILRRLHKTKLGFGEWGFRV